MYLNAIIRFTKQNDVFISFFAYYTEAKNAYTAMKSMHPEDIIKWDKLFMPSKQNYVFYTATVDCKRHEFGYCYDFVGDRVNKQYDHSKMLAYEDADRATETDAYENLRNPEQLADYQNYDAQGNPLWHVTYFRTIIN